MDLTAAAQYGAAHVLNHTGQAVGAYVGVRIGQYGFTGSVLAEYVQYAVRIAAFLAAGVELAVRVGAGTALAKAVVGLRVYLMGAAYESPPGPAPTTITAGLSSTG